MAATDRAPAPPARPDRIPEGQALRVPLPRPPRDRIPGTEGVADLGVLGRVRSVAPAAGTVEGARRVHGRRVAWRGAG